MKRCITKNTNKIIKKLIFPVLAALLASIAITGCTEDGTVEPETVIGNEGIVFARTIATRYPYRKAGSPEESAVSALIVAELKSMGFKPEIQKCQSDEISTSNIIVRIAGSGFETDVSGPASAEPIKIERSIIIGAHYDTPLGTADKEKYPEYDGIHDNASGVGALLSIAKELRTRKNGYDVVIVFFGAGNSDFLGARTFAAEMSAAEIADTDAMYCLDSIYAGDKLYAHAGLNSLEEGKKYIRRRKLYELSDVAIENTIDLRFNESDLDFDVNSDGTADVYREVTSVRSDYSVFDLLNIPCVFIESHEYFASAVVDQIESKNPYFGGTKGMITGTNFDSTKYLEDILEEGRLELRIKNVVFLVIKAIEKGIYK
ncbi:MAG: M28 family peptidase [Saccharofermentanales bacterium]